MRDSRSSSPAFFLGLLLAAPTACGGAPNPPQEPRSAPPRAVLNEVVSQCRGDSFQIDLAEMQDAHVVHAPEERIEQWRDWIFPILLGRLEASVGLEGLLISNASSPLLRDDALAHVLDQQVGSTRSASAEGGEVVVMVEHAAPAAMQAGILEAVDQEALHLAASPQRVIVYEYELDERAGYAHLCQLETLELASLESEEQGFRRATLRTVADLKAFIGGGVDLLSAQCTDQGLEVTGRTRPRVGQAPITPEHIAALRRSRELQYVPLDQLHEYLPPQSKELQQWYSDVAYLAENPELMELPEMKRRLDKSPEVREAIARVRVWKRTHRKVPTHELVLSWLGQQRDPQQLGFSLDPKLRPRDGIKAIDELLAAVDDRRRLAALFYAWRVEPEKAADVVRLFEEARGAREVLSDAFSDLRRAFGRQNIDAYGTLTNAQAISGGLGDALVAATAALVDEHASYQCARYIGPLQGTATGMTMFYTDLLMKIWSGDYFNAAPDGVIPGFKSVASDGLSDSYCSDEDIKYRNTRAWLGLREEQYAREDAEQLRFAPIATRVFVRSSTHGAEYSDEVAATPRMHRFYQWWNAHYARVATWEPQYELLNQILKWAVVVQSAEISEHSGCAGFLDQITVNRGHRFDRWLTAHEELRWRGPVALVHPDEEPTECLPILRSRRYGSCGSDGAMTGGVSAGSKLGLAARPLRHMQGPRQLRRFAARSPEVPRVEPGGRVTYASISTSEGTLRNVRVDPGKGSFSAGIETSQRQLGARHGYALVGQNGGQPVTHAEHAWQRQGGRLAGRGTVNQKYGVAQLEADDVRAAVVRAQVQLHDVATVRTVGREVADGVATGKDLSKAVADAPQVTKAWQLSRSQMVVKLSPAGGGRPRYGLMSSGDGNRGPPDALSATFSEGSAKVTITLIDETQAMTLIRQHKEIVMSARTSLAQLEEALVRADMPTVRKRIDAMANAANQAAIRRLLRRWHRDAVRAGKDTADIEELSTYVALRHGKPTGPVPQTSDVPADAAVVYVPRKHLQQYSEVVSTPSSAIPSARPDTTYGAFHARILEEEALLANQARTIPAGGDEYVPIVRAQEAQPLLLGLRAGRSAYVIHPCSEDPRDDTSVRCHGRGTARADEGSYQRYLLRQACELGEQQARKLGVTGCSELDRP